MPYWWCLDCHAQIELDEHGRCSVCKSDAVAPSIGTPREFFLNYHAQFLTRRIEEA